ncbi:hypothetical protein [Legionella fallonii]|uniref:hypothetical protein n=1 Tax=Legionella fallonii TaxID=96230 RepID=UPI000A5F895F|nr:hypothetical protein [Legionella fallonii]
MMTKKLLLCGMLTITTLCPTSSFAYYHSHPTPQPRFKYHHHHSNPWRNGRLHHHRRSHGSYIEVQPRNPIPQIHHHY